MTNIAFKLDGFFENTLLNFEYNEMDHLTSIEESIEEDTTLFLVLDSLRNEIDTEVELIVDDLLTPRLSLINFLDLSFEDDSLPLFTDLCSEDVFRPVPIYTLETQMSVR